MGGIFQAMCTAIFIIASLQHVMSQNSRRPLVHSSIDAPQGLAVGSFINSVTQQQAIVAWIPENNARTYTIRLYTRDDDVLQREITNVKTPVMILEDLDAGTHYSITVSAVYENAQQLLVESTESNALNFDTREECRGGQIWTECYGGCIARCDEPDPECARICQPGCNCPLEANIWDGFACVVPELCPTVNGTPVAVNNFHVVDSTSARTVLAWDIQDGAHVYEVTVRLAENRSTIVQRQTSNIPVIGITGLTPGVIYSFGVVAFVRNIDTIAGRDGLVLSLSALPPPTYRIINVQETSFTVAWSRSGDSIRYAFVVFDESDENVLYENDNIGGTSITIDQLAPGTVYFFSLAAAGPNEEIGIFSPKTLVRTLGQKKENYNPQEAVLDLMIELPASTVRPTGVRSNRTITNCLQEYQGVELFYQQFPNSHSGPRFPNCQQNGNYVPTLCEVDNPEACHCIDETDGVERKGSNFGGDNSHFPIDCANYGTFEVDDVNLEIGYIRSSSIELTWTAVDQAHSYIIYVQNVNQPSDGRTIAVNANLQEYTLEELIPGGSYEIGIYVADASGKTSPLVTLEATTALVEKPQRLRALSRTESNLTVRWRVDATAEAYTIRLMLKEGNVVIEELDDVIQNRVTFTKLTALTTYVVEIRAVGFDYSRSATETLRQFSEPATLEVLVTCDLSSIDIVFAFETSGPTQFDHLQSFKALAANLMIALPDIQANQGTRAAALRFNNQPNYIFDYNRFKTTSNAVGALRYIRHIGGNAPQLGAMMSSVTSRYFKNPPNSGYRSRRNGVSVVMIFTSGRRTRSLNSAATSYISQARTLRRYTNVVTIGVDNWSNEKVLREIATPNLNILFPTFDKLETSADKVLERLCTIN